MKIPSSFASARALALGASVSAAPLLVLVTLPGCRDRDRTFDREHANVIPEENDKAPVGTASLTGAAWVSADVASDRLASTRCAHGLTCGDVGPDKHYATSDACILESRKAMRVQLDPNACANGVDGKALDDCLDAVRTEACNHRFDSLTRLPPCHASEICAKPGP